MGAVPERCLGLNAERQNGSMTGGRRLRGKEIGNRCADVMWSPERRGKVRADARISKQRQQEPPHAQTIEGRGVTWPGLVANDLSSSVWCQYIYFTGPHQVGASTFSNQASSD